MNMSMCFFGDKKNKLGHACVPFCIACCLRPAKIIIMCVYGDGGQSSGMPSHACHAMMDGRVEGRWAVFHTFFCDPETINRVRTGTGTDAYPSWWFPACHLFLHPSLLFSSSRREEGAHAQEGMFSVFFIMYLTQHGSVAT